MSAGGQFLLAANGHFHVRQWAFFHVRRHGVSPTQHQIMLNGGDGDFFDNMRGGKWWTKPFVRAAYGNAVIAAPGAFDVYISQDAIKARASDG